jgi:hypothetical protein
MVQPCEDQAEQRVAVIGAIRELMELPPGPKKGRVG